MTKPSDPIRVLLVDDDPLVRSSLKIIIETDANLRVVGLGGNGDEAISLYDALLPDLLLMDIRMSPCDGLDAGEAILARHPQARILYLTTFADDEYIIKALRMGARGYILKQDFESIVPSLQAVSTGQSVFGDTIMARMPTLIGSRIREGGQSDEPGRSFPIDIRDKELELVRLVAEGLNNKEIAARVFLSEGTVRNQLSVILEKLDLRDRTQLAIFYYKNFQP